MKLESWLNKWLILGVIFVVGSWMGLYSGGREGYTGGGGSFFESYGILLVFENAIKTNLGVM